MKTTDRPEERMAPGEGEVATTIREAGLCQLVTAARADAIAAATLLATGCDASGIPFHVCAIRTREELRSRLASADPDTDTVVIGADGHGTPVIADPPVSGRAHAVASELGADPDASLALAGVVAAGFDPADAVPELLSRADADPTTGVAVPTEDPADGLAHTTLAHADFSGEKRRAEEELAELGASPEPRDVASLLAIAATGPAGASTRSATAIERSIRPYRIPGPFATVGGYADVLSALVRRSPGLAITLTMTGEGRDAALSAWRERAVRTHAAVRSADTERYDGLLVAHVDGPVAPVARLLRDFRSPEPTVLAVDDGEAAIAATETDVAGSIEAGADAAGGSGLGHGRRGYARFEAGATDALVDAVRGAT
ncbi:MAG: exonuclease RecJ [Halobacteriales archaeon]